MATAPAKVTAVTYGDGKTEAQKGDTVLGADIKGKVVSILRDKQKVGIEIVAPYDPRKPKRFLVVERDASTVNLVHRKA